MVGTAGHDFHKITFFQDFELMDKLSKLVTTDPVKGVLSTVTGIPPHVSMSVQIKLIVEQCSKIFDAVTSQTTQLIDSVTKAIDEKTWDSGHITGDRLKNMLEGLKNYMTHMVNDQFQDLNRTIFEKKRFRK